MQSCYVHIKIRKDLVNNMKLSVVKLGLIEYQSALDLQLKVHKLRQQELIEDVLFLLEHPPVITIGTSGKEANILVDKVLLTLAGINVYHTSRGGDVTYHGPGQLVGYPIINLNNHGKDIKSYVRRLEETFIQLLGKEFDIKAERNPAYPGVWVGNDKITALGGSVLRWVTMHGFAFNINTDLEHFRWINPCGITDKGVTSLQKLLGSSQDIDKLMQLVIKYFSTLFDYEPEIIEKNE
ncbi:MAG: lipoate-protein ligase [Clostridiales bacterium]|nr:lipoate-protein ligase [Clostridiales bacterium]